MRVTGKSDGMGILGYYDDANTCLLLYCECGVQVHLLARAHKDGEVTRLDDPFVTRGKRRRSQISLCPKDKERTKACLKVHTAS